MRSILVITLIGLFHIMGIHAQNIDEKLELKGKVKKIRYLDYDVDSNGQAKIGYGRFTSDIVVNYDKKGRKTEVIYYSQPNTIYFSYKNTYSKQGYLLSNMTYYGDEKISNNGYHYSYGKTGILLVDTFLYDGRCKENNIYEYDSNGKIISTLYYYWESLQSKTEYTYNGNGQCSQVYTEYYQPYADTKTISYTQTINHLYDEKGNKIQTKEFDTDHNLHSTTNYKYNLNGLLTEEKTRNSEGEEYNWFEYDYDTYGNKTKIISHSSEEPFITEWIMEYEYDNHGNWIKVTTKIDGKITEIETRDIKY